METNQMQQMRYEIYVTNAEALGWIVKSFDEWLNS
jgi:hypothetical protein